MSILSPIRLDIQALRAVAVLMVVAFHLWPHRITGGFAGVDVFFVISGFLISRSIFEELTNRNRVALTAFWAKRIRRLLPAALLVIGVTSIAVLIFIPAFTRQTFFNEAIASIFYVENWQLAVTSTNYFTGEPSPFQHYWSLAVEEQFYLLWPLLLTIFVFVSRKTTKSAVKNLLITIAIMSFSYSLFMSFNQPDLAYFTTFGRVWEFALGALVALLGNHLRLSQSNRVALSLFGFAVILGSAFLLNEQMVFPGWVALIPSLGTAAVILAGLQSLPIWLEKIYGLKFIAFTGEISYSLYLWHWPLIILLPWVTGYRLRPYELIVILVATYLIAYLSKRFVEDRFRTMPALTSRKPRLTYVYAGAISLILLAISGIGSGITAAEVSSATSQAPTLDRAKNDTADPEHRCMTGAESVEIKICKYGRIGADYRVLLVGDSHVAMHLGAWQRLADSGQFELNLIYKASCSFNLSERSVSDRGRTCKQWNVDLQKKLAVADPYQLVITSYYTAVRATEITGDHEDATIAGFKDAWAPLQARGATLVAVRDGVNMDKQMRACWESAVYDASQCSMRENKAFITDLAQRAAVSQPGALTLDFTDLYCQNNRCPAIVNGVYVFRDSSHISFAFSRSMAKDWSGRLAKLGVRLPNGS